MLNQYTGVKKCPNCSGPIFKYVNFSKNTYVLSCGYTKLVTHEKGYIESKKKPCDFYNEFSELIYYNDENDIDELYYSRDENYNPNNLSRINKFIDNINEDDIEEYSDDNESYSEEEGYDLTNYEEECDNDSDIESEQSEEGYLD